MHQKPFEQATSQKRPAAGAGQRTPRRKQAGTTLVESLVTLAVVGVTVGAAIPSFVELADRQRLQSLVAQVETDLFHARSLAVDRNQVLRISFDGLSAPGCYVLHTGTTAAQCRCSTTEPAEAVCTGAAQALRVTKLGSEQRLSLAANVGAMAFEPSRGTVTPAGTVRMLSASGERVNLVVNIMGRARACSPNGAAGWPAC
jgi:type IV fimbrial biogenesis protein FimT